MRTVINKEFKRKLFSGEAVNVGALTLDLENDRILLQYDALRFNTTGDVSFLYKGEEIAYQIGGMGTAQISVVLTLTLPMPAPLPVDIMGW